MSDCGCRWDTENYGLLHLGDHMKDADEETWIAHYGDLAAARYRKATGMDLSPEERLARFRAHEKNS